MGSRIFIWLHILISMVSCNDCEDLGMGTTTAENFETSGQNYKHLFYYQFYNGVQDTFVIDAPTFPEASTCTLKSVTIKGVDKGNFDSVNGVANGVSTTWTFTPSSAYLSGGAADTGSIILLYTWWDPSDLSGGTNAFPFLTQSITILLVVDINLLCGSNGINEQMTYTS